MKSSQRMVWPAFALAGFCLIAAGIAGADPPAAAPATPAAAPAVYTDPKAPTEVRVSDLLGRLTQPEKFSLLSLQQMEGLTTPPIPRLGIPAIRTADAPQGVRDGQSTFFPMGIVMASTWDPPLIHRVGVALGQEAKAHNRQIIYGPDVNIHRSPQGGRNFESFSEDPFLSARLAVAYIQGEQSEGVATCVKHYACNEQETDRMSVNVQVDERALREIYLPAFYASCHQAQAWSIMPALDRVNGSFSAENTHLLSDILKTEWGYDGMILGDWGSIHDTAAAINAGNDMEMPHPNHYSPIALQAALDGKLITQAQIDDMVRRILRLMARTGLLDGKPPAGGALNTPEHQKLALQVAQEGITLLKNTGHLLPLDRAKIKTIAVIGPNAAVNSLGGRWSADVHPFDSVSVLDALKKKLGDKVAVSFAEGCPRTAPAGGTSVADAAALAGKADVAIVVVGLDNNIEGENLDPPSLRLPGDQDKLIQAVAAANKNTIVILVNGTHILMDQWLAKTPGVIESWYAGQDAGTAVADVLFGDVNPSGKLPDTLAVRREDYPDFGNYPGSGGNVRYAEGLYVGYRHFDKHNVAPLFPFGYGLSYTTFAYSGLLVPPVMKRGQTVPVKVTIQNTGKRAGDEIVQLYVHDLAPKVDRPVRELKGFQRVSLKPGEKKQVVFPLDEGALAYYNVQFHRWKSNEGAYAIEIGASSRDIRAKGILRLQ